MNGVRDARDLKEKIGGILAQLCDFLNKNPLKKRGWGIRIIRDNRFMVQIEMRHLNRNKAVEVDILPTFDAAVNNGNSLRKLYRSMALYDYDTQQFCSAALATLQRDFIKTKPTKLKSLIRLVKHWCKMYLPWEYGQPRVPNSYLLELLTISVWENAGSQHSFPTALLFKDVMEALYNHRQLNVKWNTYYSLSGNLSGGKPCIMDPANPYNNVYDVVGDWKRVKRVARETLKKPLLRDYSRSVLDTDNSRSPNCCILFILLLLICLFLFYSILSPGDAELLIVQTAVQVARTHTTVLVCNDTDLLVLLIYHGQMNVATGNICVQPESLPPTYAAACFHSLSVYHQVQHWKGTNLPPQEWGWEMIMKGGNAPTCLLPMHCHCWKSYATLGKLQTDKEQVKEVMIIYHRDKYTTKDAFQRENCGIFFDSYQAEVSLEALAYKSSPYDDFRELRPAYLDKFIAEQLQPDEEFHSLFYNALDKLCRYLHQYMRPPTVKRLLKGGSMGKGTALKGRSDLDCILVMNGVRDARDLNEKISEILNQLRRLLSTDPLIDQGWRIMITRVNDFMVTIKMKHYRWSESVEVDILPTFDADVYRKDSRDQLYNSMALYDRYTEALCSAALAELQRDFIKQRPAKLKNLIRLVKHWCKTYLPLEYDGQPRVPNSYLLELLTISDPQCRDLTRRRIKGKWPCIMDPANPYANVYEVVRDWKRVERVARETLRKPLLRNYRSSVLDTRDEDEEEVYEESSSASYCFDFRNAKIAPKRKSHFLNKLISAELQTNKEFRDLISNATNDLCHHIQHNCDYSANRMIKGGSLGKGTALKGTSDLDCVLVLNEMKNVEDLIHDIDEVKGDLKSCLDTLPARSAHQHGWKITFERMTPFSVQFTMTKISSPSGVVEVDLLPTFNIPESDLNEIYREMRLKNANTRRYYSAALTELQRDFVKELPARIKDLIRLVKYWCKRFVKQGNIAHAPSSYLLELITIHAWEKVDKPTTINMAIAFKAVMEELNNYQNLNAVWHRYYQENQEMSDHKLPRVIDPANPYNNLCDGVDWMEVARIAEETMRKPLFQDIPITSHWCRGPPPRPSRRRRLRQMTALCYASDDEFNDFRF
ncbi:2'-5'-oligoadenylate synthase 3-like [Actinia tenebrosa]|uniref:2'-5'-oligoadenylate synthase 3-like n=1 Tax=Actinia tenebrosa TaxID=6105 RepID=A0A6P8H0P3_ACTTE|nr:2'-5'-oligoadenylate synthase 3-like [Actinia tenebrosa]